MSDRMLGSLRVLRPPREGAEISLAELARSPFADQAAALWTDVGLALGERSPRVGTHVVFVGGPASVYAAAAIALGAAREERAVALVDVSQSRPGLANPEAGKRDAGFAELARGGMALESLHEAGGAIALALVPPGAGLDALWSEAARGDLQQALEALRVRAELVVVAGPLFLGERPHPLLELADAFAWVRVTEEGAESQAPGDAGPAAGASFDVPGVHLGEIEVRLPAPRGRERWAGKVAAPGAASAAGAKGAGVAAGAKGAPPAGAGAAGTGGATAAGEGAASGRAARSRWALLVGGGAVALAAAVFITMKMGSWQMSDVWRALGREPAARARAVPLGEPLPFGAGERGAEGEASAAWWQGAWGGSESGAATAEVAAATTGMAAAIGPAASARTEAQLAAAQPTAPVPSAPAAPSPSPAAPARTAPTRSTSSPARPFVVYVSSNRVRANAEKAAATLRRQGFAGEVWAVDLPGSGRWFRVVAGACATRDEAAALAAVLARSGGWPDAKIARREETR